MVLCTKIVTNTNEKVFAWATNNPNYANKYIESKIEEIHFSNGLVFKFNHSTCLSAELSWFLLKHKFAPFGSKYVGSAIVELRSFPCKGYKLLDYLDFVSVKEFEDTEREKDRTLYAVVKKNPDDYGVVTESLCYTVQLNSLCDIVLQGELMPHDYSYMYSRKGTLITVIFAAYKRRHFWYKYTYNITDLEKFQTLLTKIHIQYSEFFK